MAAIFINLAIALLVIVILIAQIRSYRIKKMREAEVAKIMRQHWEKQKQNAENSQDNPASESVSWIRPNEQNLQTEPSGIWSPKPIAKRELELMIQYISHGEKKERQISVYGLGQHGHSYYIVGYCHLRHEIRHFKLKGSRKCIDLGSGEVVTNIKNHILAFNPVIEDLTAEYEASKSKRHQDDG